MKPEEIFDVYSKNYIEKFNSNPVAIYQRQSVHDALQPLMINAKSLLDVGCGPGSDFEFYKNFDTRITAIDISPKMVQLAKNKADLFQLNAEIINSSLETLETKKTFDIILLNFGVINVIKKIEDTLNKLEVFLNPSGKLIIVSMPPFHMFTIFEKVFRFQLKQICHRLIIKKAILDNGFKFYYYSKHNFYHKFKIRKIINLCSILPTPDQYAHYKFLRFYFKIFWKFDKRINKYLPTILGGDHILFELEQK